MENYGGSVEAILAAEDDEACDEESDVPDFGSPEVDLAFLNVLFLAISG